MLSQEVIAPVLPSADVSQGRHAVGNRGMKHQECS